MKNTPFFMLESVGQMLAVLEYPNLEARFCNSELLEFGQIKNHSELNWPQWIGIDGFNEFRRVCQSVVEQNLARAEAQFAMNESRKTIQMQCKPLLIESKKYVVVTLQTKLDEQSIVETVNRFSKFSEIGKMTAGIAHELNNPLSILQGNTDHLEILIGKNKLEPETLKKMVLAFQKAIDRMNRIVKSMSSLVREQNPEFKNQTLEEIIAETLNLDRATLKHNKVNVEFNPDQRNIIHCDYTRVEQALLSTLSFFMGRYTLQTSPAQIKISTTKVEDRVELRLEANCDPMSQEQFSQKFLSKEDLEKNSQGLSLYATSNTLKSMGASFKCEKSDSQSTIFLMQFVPAQSSQVGQYGGMRVMLVDDEDFSRQIFAEKLLDYGCKVDEAASGERALELLQQGTYDLVVSDMRMAGMQGDEFIKRAAKANPNLYFVITTGYSVFSIDTGEFDPKHYLGTLKKPLIEEELHKVLNSVQATRLEPAKEAA